MSSLEIDFQKTALVIIDLQKGIVAMPGGQEIVEKASRLCLHLVKKTMKLLVNSYSRELVRLDPLNNSCLK